MRIILGLMILLFSCSNNNILLQRLDKLEQRITELEDGSKLFPETYLWMPADDPNIKIWDGSEVDKFYIDGIEIEKFNLDRIQKMIKEWEENKKHGRP